MLPIKTLAYGVLAHCFADYFLMSKTGARTACHKFDTIIGRLYSNEYMRSSTPSDLMSINQLYLAKHGRPGFFGCLDCCHTVWKNCPKTWQRQFAVKVGKLTIIMEALGDFNLWLGHESFGHADTMNDLNVLEITCLVNQFVNGSFKQVEEQLTCILFTIGFMI